jgi:poly(hydroxyalkanoate) depolymerase family esterase
MNRLPKKGAMHPDFQQLMQEATRLTQAGDLQGATATIQAALGGGAKPQASAPSAPGAGIVIDVDAVVLPSPANESTASDVPPKAKDAFIAGHWGNGPAGRDYKLYLPPQAGTKRLPMVVMLHGCTQHPDDFAAGTRMNEAARERGFIVLYPAQSREANPQACWNWFKHSHQVRGRGEAALLAGMTRELAARHGADPARIYVAGLSAGGAMAAILGDTYPELFAAVGVHSGLAAGAARDLPSALAAMKGGSDAAPARASGRPTIVFHGDADRTVHPANGEQVIAASIGAEQRPEAQQQRAPGGRQYTRTVHRGAGGHIVAEHWLVHGSGHAWSGGSTAGSYTDPRGPDATAEMLRFFLQHRRQAPER